MSNGILLVTACYSSECNRPKISDGFFPAAVKKSLELADSPSHEVTQYILDLDYCDGHESCPAEIVRAFHGNYLILADGEALGSDGVGSIRNTLQGQVLSPEEFQRVLFWMKSKNSDFNWLTLEKV